MVKKTWINCSRLNLLSSQLCVPNEHTIGRRDGVGYKTLFVNFNLLFQGQTMTSRSLNSYNSTYAPITIKKGYYILSLTNKNWTSSKFLTPCRIWNFSKTEAYNPILNYLLIWSSVCWNMNTKFEYFSKAAIKVCKCAWEPNKIG